MSLLRRAGLILIVLLGVGGLAWATTSRGVGDGAGAPQTAAPAETRAEAEPWPLGETVRVWSPAPGVV